MSRHRHVRNLNYEDYRDEDYGHDEYSEEEYGYEESHSEYIYNRDPVARPVQDFFQPATPAKKKKTPAPAPVVEAVQETPVREVQRLSAVKPSVGGSGGPKRVRFPYEIPTPVSTPPPGAEEPEVRELKRQASVQQHLMRSICVGEATSKKREKRREELLANRRKTQDKPRVNLVVIGHVDAGKSTLLGHLLYLSELVSQRQLRKYQKECKALGKASFHFAWVLDQHQEERNRGITVDVGVRNLETPHRLLTLLDAPGHRDFIPNMILGAAQADAAVLVVPATVGEFESGFRDNGQTKEHAILARSLGVEQLILAVNKLDAAQPAWSEARFHEVVANVKPFLKKAGFREKNVWPVPVSGLTGENLTVVTRTAALEWWKGKSLLELMDTLKPPQREANKPFRLCVSDVFRTMALGVTVAGKMETGSLMPDDKVLVLPLNAIAKTRGVAIHGQGHKIAVAGDNIEMGLKNLSEESVSAIAVGHLLCCPLHPTPMVKRIRARILTLNFKIPLLRGTQVIFHSQCANAPAVVHRLVSVLDKATGVVSKKRPRCVGRNMSAIVDIKFPNRTVPLELYQDFRALGRFSLRRGDETVAVGIVVKLFNVVKHGVHSEERAAEEVSPSPSPSEEKTI